MAEWVNAALDSDASDEHRVAARSALLVLVQQSKVSITDIVLHLGPSLTSTDYFVRSKGMTFLGEMVALLHSTRLEEHAVQSLVLFFTARLEDSACLHGALRGCHSLQQRSENLGAVAARGAVEMVKTLEWLDVQSLGQQDRLLLYEILESVFERHPSEVGTLGIDLVTGVAQVIEGEKDPRCLLLAFRLVERLGALFPDPNGPLAQAAAELFDVVACYFPISFKLRASDSKEITREDLSAGLERAFSSSSFFASECISLLLEKLSSSVQDSKLQSLHFLGTCATAYGAGVMEEYARPIWIALKAELFPWLTSFYLESGRSHDTDVLGAALDCLTRCVRACQSNSEGHDEGLCLRLILDDEISNDLLKYLSCKAIAGDRREKLHVRTAGQVFSATARASPLSGRIISTAVFPAFLSNRTCSDPVILDVVVSVLTTIQQVAAEESSHSLLRRDPQWSSGKLLSSMKQLATMFLENLKASAPVNGARASLDELKASSVRGMQHLAAFPGYLSSLSRVEAEGFVSGLLALVLGRRKCDMHWDKAVEAVASVCAAEVRESIDPMSCRVVHTLVRAAVLEDGDENSLMGAITRISMSSGAMRDKFFNELQRQVLPLSVETAAAARHRNLTTLFANEFLALYERDVEHGHALALQMSLEIWCSLELFPLDTDVPEEILVSWMDLVRAAARICDRSGQEALLRKAYGVVCSKCSSRTEEWAVALWSSTAIALRPGIQLLQDEKVIKLLMNTSGEARSVRVSECTAQAVASILNKWCPLSHPLGDVVDDILVDLRASDVQDATRVVNILAWAGKALGMRGDGKVAAVAGILFDILKVGKESTYAKGYREDGEIRRAAAKALSLLAGGDCKSLDKRHFATVRPLYSQRFFNSFLPPLFQALSDASDTVSRAWMIRGLSYLVVNVPPSAVLLEGDAVFPLLLEALTDIDDPDIVLGNLLLVSAFLMDDKSKGLVTDRIGAVANCLVELSHYQHLPGVRETALQCLGALVTFPYASVYPLSRKVSKAVRRALDDPKRSVRNEAARCGQAWWIR